ncbi:molybdate ABC transporter substrate-binding protein [Methanogenium organophilum]|uniref:Molybdate ABC transporter substrate-binding protein n=1 Tax=Methanogenium organophilum TaxID=2199 RepID=A0A9X9S5U6_METOG|nr:molybdate ABC transporter substrate-binding protein [Methanogenium organophilum]WAI02298.1 molybdate ABC transporter substrate-binding protein [Methanogenium organophilum]
MKTGKTALVLLACLMMGAVLLVAGCTTTSDVTPSANAEKSITVFTAGSLKGAFTEMAAAYEDEHPGTTVVLNIDGTQALRTQVEQGARGDVFASANTKHMDALMAGGFMENDTVSGFLENRVTIALPVSNPGDIHGLADLSTPGEKVLIGTPEVPVGGYARQVLEKMAADPEYGENYTEAVMANIISEETNVNNIIAKLLIGEADAGFTYTSDVVTPAYADQLTTIPIPDEYNVVAHYPIGVLKESTDPETAEDFIAFVRSGPGGEILRTYGFEPL